MEMVKFKLSLKESIPSPEKSVGKNRRQKSIERDRETESSLEAREAKGSGQREYHRRGGGRSVETRTPGLKTGIFFIMNYLCDSRCKAPSHDCLVSKISFPTRIITHPLNPASNSCILNMNIHSFAATE